MDGAAPKRSDQDLGGAPEGLDALTVAERLKADGGLGLFVARDYARMGEFVQAFGFFAKDVEIIEFPAWDCLPYDRLSPTSSVSAERMAALTKLAQRRSDDLRPVLVVTTIAEYIHSRIAELGATGLLQPLKLSCKDHEGGGAAGVELEEEVVLALRPAQNVAWCLRSSGVKQMVSKAAAV